MNKIPKAKADSLLLGGLKSYVSNPIDFLDRHFKEYGDTFRFRLAYRYLTVTNNPEYIRHILQTNHRNYRKSLAYRKLRLLLGNGLFTNEGESWLLHRRIAQPAFHKQKINAYAEKIQDYAEEMVGRWKGLEKVDLLHESTQVTLKIISQTLLGVEVGKEAEIVEKNLPVALSYMMRRVTSSINKPLWFPDKDIKSFKKSVRELDLLIDTIIKDKRKENKGDDLLSSLMTLQDEETGESMNDKQLRDEVITFFLAGHETSAIALTWTLYFLGTHPAVLVKLKDELSKELTPSARVGERLSKLSYTKAVVQEAMRLVSPIWILGREALKEDKIGDYTIKAGDSIIFSPYFVHRSDEYWDDPESFVPERFLDASIENSNYYFPFGGGPRLCIGNNFAIMELMILLAVVVHSGDIELVDHKHPGFDFSLTLRPKDKIYLKYK